jgi:serine/threonine protein kinase
MGLISCTLRIILIEISSQVFITHLIDLENLVFARKNDLSSIKIVDLGLIAEVEWRTGEVAVGTPLYRAPEQITKQNYSKSVDVWAAGFILYLLCSGGRHPVYDRKMSNDSYNKAMLACVNKKWIFPNGFPTLPKQLFIKMCLNDYRNRYESYSILSHPWVTRAKNALIPITRIESAQKKMHIRYFRQMLQAMILLQVYKSQFLMKKINTNKNSSLSPSKTKKLSTNMMNSNNVTNIGNSGKLQLKSTRNLNSQSTYRGRNSSVSVKDPNAQFFNNMFYRR